MERDDLGLESAPAAVAVVGVGAILPDAPDVQTFWKNVLSGKDSITEVPPDRWSIAHHYDPDASVPDKTYCKIGGFVRGFEFDSVRLRIPPRVAAAMDIVQQWTLVCARQALIDAGHPDGKIDPARTGVILGNALGGELHERTSMRALLPSLVPIVEGAPELAALAPAARAAAARRLIAAMQATLPPITEDTMPGELGNIIAGRVTNVLDLGGMNFTTDAACASSLAALDAAMAALANGRVDTVITGGADRSMAPPTYVKFSKIGALSPDGSRPFDAGANGFVMGEGCAVFVLRRLADAERDGQRIYAVIRSVGASSDGKGKGITAPNPLGQMLALQRAYEIAGISPASVGLIEAHGTSTRVGDAIEAECLTRLFDGAGLEPHSVAVGSVKSQIGHLKSGAGAAGLLKAILALHHKTLPPTINVRQRIPAIAERGPLWINTQAQPWERPAGGVRRAAVSSFGFGGTNFHAVVEEHVPGLLTQPRRAQVAVGSPRGPSAPPAAVPPRGVLCLGRGAAAELRTGLARLVDEAKRGELPPAAPPRDLDLAQPERLVIDYGSARELVDKGEKALAALDSGSEGAWKLLRARGVFRQSGPAPKVAFLFPGQGSQYLGMLRQMRESVAEVRDTFAEADAIMARALPQPLSSYILGGEDPAASEAALRDTTVCQPAVLTVDVALARLLARYGIRPDMVMGHSLGEYAALVAAGAMPFGDAIQAVSARAKEMSSVSIADNGKMASVFASEADVRRVLAEMDGYVVAANLNSHGQTVIGGATRAVERAVARFEQLGMKAVLLPVSHAFHTEIVAPASKPLRAVLERLALTPPAVSVISNVTGEPYPSHAGAREQMLDLLARQVASPVQFVSGLETLYRLGVRVFVEVGPRKVLATFVEDVLGERGDVLALCTNQPKKGEIESFAEALCGLYAAGLGRQGRAAAASSIEVSMPKTEPRPSAGSASQDDGHLALGRMFAGFLREGFQTYQQHFGDLTAAPAGGPTRPAAGAALAAAGAHHARSGSIVITGASLGLPGRARHVFDDGNVDAILNGETCIDPLPIEQQRRMVDKHIVRLNKRADGGADFETISGTGEVLHLAGQRGKFNLVEDFGVAKERAEVFDVTTQLAVAAALLALRDARIPLVRRYRQTTVGSWLPDRWVLPESLADETGVIFASAFPGYDALVAELERYYTSHARQERLDELKAVRAKHPRAQVAELDERIARLERELKRSPYHFDRKFVFQVLSMGHSQLAELIGARGPNTQVNAACASAAQALGIAEGWIRQGACRRVIVVSADDVTAHMMEWIGTSFLAMGAATTESEITRAALPFDRRRHGLILGMGASGLIVESEDAVRERGMRGIAEVLGVESSNSAFHGSKLDVDHIGQVMERIVSRVESERGVSRARMAPETVFVSHETYTPARGGSAAAEIHSLRRVFRDGAAKLIIANTKGMTGHPMGAGVEEAVAVKILETGRVPPVPNLREPDPELGDLSLSRGGTYPVRYALRLAAGFGSQVVISLLKKIEGSRLADAASYQKWLEEQSGAPGAATEIENRTLRVRDGGPPARAPAKSRWTPGAGPTLWAEEPAPGAPPEPAAAPAAFTTAPREEPAASAVPTRAATEAVAPQPAPAADAVEDRLVGLVAAKTGYPRDMLALDLDLEADLGIDTVKQAEIFSELRAAFAIPKRDDLKLRDYPTLGALVRLVHELQPGAPVPETTAATAALDTAPAPGGVVRRVPVPVIRPPLAACKPTGIELAAGMRVIVVPDESGVAAALSAKLAARGAKVLTLAPGDVAPQVDAWRKDGPIAGVFHLAALDTEPDVADADLATVRAVFDARVRRLAVLIRALLPAWGGERTFLVAGTRLGGLHGYGHEPATAPAGGAVSGFVKACGREQPGATVKVVDFPASDAADVVAAALVGEAERDPGAVEIGYAHGTRHAIGLVATTTPRAEPSLALTSESVLLITGAGGGITAAITRDLAAASRGTFWLLDVAPVPDATDPDLQRLGDREALRREIFERLKAKGERVTPAQVEKAIAELERSAAVLAAVHGVTGAGGKAEYRSVDVRDAAAVAAVVDEIKARHGRIDVVVHAAGLERSRGLADKPQEEFDRVFDVKALGACNVLRAARGLHVGAFVSFSSVAGRFGNAGQTDYSAANDFLCKLTAALPRSRPQTRAVVIDWTAWADVGMATRGSIPEIMRRAGIDTLPLAEGLPIVREELAAGTRGELVVGKALGILTQARDPEGGLDVAAMTARLAAEGPPMIGRVLGLDLYEGLRIETVLDPEVEPFLRDHVIDGVPVLPGVMGLEGFAEVARLLVPEYHVAGFEGVRFEAPLKYYKRQPRPGVFRALVRRVSPELIQVDITLSSTRALATGATAEVPHFRGTVNLTRAASEPRAARNRGKAARALRQVSADDIYRIYFHGPSYRVLGDVEVTEHGVRGRLRDGLPPALARPNAPMLVAPRLIELCLQTAGVYEIGKTGRLALPAAIDRLVAHGTPAEAAGLRAEIEPRGEGNGLYFDARVCDGDGRVYLELEGYRTSALPNGLPEELVAPLRTAVVGEA